MHDALPMRVVERGTQVGCDAHRTLDGQRFVRAEREQVGDDLSTRIVAETLARVSPRRQNDDTVLQRTSAPSTRPSDRLTRPEHAARAQGHSALQSSPSRFYQVLTR